MQENKFISEIDFIFVNEGLQSSRYVTCIFNNLYTNVCNFRFFQIGFSHIMMCTILCYTLLYTKVLYFTLIVISKMLNGQIYNLKSKLLNPLSPQLKSNFLTHGVDIMAPPSISDQKAFFDFFGHFLSYSKNKDSFGILITTALKMHQKAKS